jgi:CDP-glucose 4,6-dehydratase
MELNRDFWRGRRVFVTGHTGFKGSWLLLMLRELGAQVHGYSLPPPTDPSLFDLLGLDALCEHRVGDIRDLAGVEAAVQQARPEVVLHLAAQPLVRVSYADPVETYSSNVMGTVHVLDACRRAPDLKSIVVVTTDKCYENVGWVWGYRENDRLGGADPYSNSKAACELVVDAYRRSFFNPRDHERHGVGLASARAGNVIGGGDFAVDRLVPDAVRAFAGGQPLMIRNPLSVRPWQHVLDPLLGYLMLAEQLYQDPRFATGWNFGPPTDESASVETVVDELVRRWGGSATWRQDPADHPHEAATLKLDSTKARLELGWRPRLSLPDALEITANWYKAYSSGEDLMALTTVQISRYLVTDH